MMRKYEPLTEYLRRQPVDVKPISFEEIERIIGEKLPRSAMRHRAWWSNNATNSVMTQAWLDAGFQSEDVDMERRKLVFRRIQPVPAHARAAVTARESARHPLIGWMKGTLTIGPDVDLAEPADPEWGAGTAAHRLERDRT